MARSDYDDDDDDRDDRGPRRRRRDDDDRDDYDDERPRRKPKPKEMGPLDGMFRDTSSVMLVLFALCCSGIALILSIIALATAKDEKAKGNAKTVLIIAIVVQVLAFVIGFAGGFVGAMK